MTSLKKKDQQAAFLWQQFLSGNGDAFSTIYQQHATALLAYGLKLSPQQEIVNDAIQDVFINLWQKRSELPAVINTRAYLLKSLRNRILRILDNRTLNGNGNQPSPAIQESCEQHIIIAEIKEERLTELYTKLQNLPTRQKEVINLRYFQNLKTAEIAAILDISSSAVMTRLFRARKKMRQILGHESVPQLGVVGE